MNHEKIPYITQFLMLLNSEQAQKGLSNDLLHANLTFIAHCIVAENFKSSNLFFKKPFIEVSFEHVLTLTRLMDLKELFYFLFHPLRLMSSTVIPLEFFNPF
jgi:hypothetical protein